MMRIARISFVAPLLGVMLLGGCSSVETKPLDTNTYALIDYYEEPPRDLSSAELMEKADEVCPQGFDILSKSATKTAEFGKTDVSCVGSKDCRYQLEWRVFCTKKNKPDSSIFGRK